jgi:hypothetical protein
MYMPSCPQCRGRIDFDDDFCFSCGAILTPSNPPPPPPSSDRPGEPPPGDDYYPPERSGWDDYDRGNSYDNRPPPRRRRPREHYPAYADEPRVTRIEHRPQKRGYDGHDRPQRRRDDSGPSGKTIAAAVVAILCILLLLGVMFTPWGEAVRDKFNDIGENIPTTPFFREYPIGAEYEVERTVVVSTKPGASSPFSYTIKIAQPMNINDGSAVVQEVLGVDPQSPPTEGTPDITTKTNNMLIWEGSINSGTDSVSIVFHVKTKTKDWLGEYNLDGSMSGTVDDINGTWKTTYNDKEWVVDIDSDDVLDPEDDLDNDGQWNYRIDPSNPRIISLSNQLTEGKTNVYDKLLSIYEYLISDDILEYETIRGSGLPKACLTTLDDLTGDCADYSILFISLCRAADIPARLVLGLLYDPGNDQWIGHGWSEVYVPLKSGGALLGTVDVVNKQFMLRDPYRITDWIDTGGDVIYNGEYVNNLDFYYYSFTYRGPGEKVSDDYSTISYEPNKDKIRVEMSDSEISGEPSNGGSSGFGFMPGFEGIGAVTAISLVVVLAYYVRRFPRQ